MSCSTLTDREIEVLRLMAQGRSNRDMAKSLGITPKTVGHHVQHIYNKIGVSTRAAAAVFAVENRLLHIPRLESAAANSSTARQAATSGR
jgi:DNA-binding CsgD family transcriptional regulator